MLNTYNVSFSVKNSKYPVENFLQITLIKDKSCLASKYKDLIKLEEDFILFDKSKVNLNKKVCLLLLQGSLYPLKLINFI